MSSLQSIKEIRLKKLANIRRAGINPYPAKTKRTHTCWEALDDFEKLAREKGRVVLAGRLRVIRTHGGSAFAHLDDGAVQLQIYFKKDKLGEKKYKFFLDNFDAGDFIEAAGEFFTTKKGEKTLLVKDFRILTKALLPLPEKWHGLKDTEERFRKRYLDLIMNPPVKEIFIKRTEIIKASREFFDKKGYLEVETPILQPIYGGGLARPFKTHHNALGIPLYLRISDELYLKRLIVGGFEKIYEICRDFRNEGIDRFHNPEFTLLEPMTAYQDYRFTMDLIEEFYEFVIKKINKNLEVKYGGTVLNFERPWERISMKEIVKKKTNFDFDKVKDLTEAKNKAGVLGISREKTEKQTSVGEILNLIFEEVVQSEIIQPTIIYDYPVEISPLAKKCAHDEDFVERFEQVIAGQEHGNNYSELNDPIDLKKRFIEEVKRKKAGFEETHQADNDFLEAIEYGMPPVSGGGISIDRLVMILTNTQNIKDVILFPILRPKE